MTSESSSAATIVFGILRFDPFTATEVFVTPLLFTGFAELGDLESAPVSSDGKSVSTSPDLREPAASALACGGTSVSPVRLGGSARLSTALESSSASEEAVASVSGAEE
jgi:hypothetical protein